MKILKKFKKLIIIELIAIIIIFSLIPPKVSYGVTSAQSEVGKAIADTANDFFDRFAEKTIYHYGDEYGEHPITGEWVGTSWSRKMAYENTMTSGYAYYREPGASTRSPHEYNHMYAMDCVGFVSMIMHRATGLKGNTFEYFGVPQTCTGTDYNLFDEFYGVEAIAGDIICWGEHVAIAIGNGDMIDSCHMGPNGQITRRPISNYSDYVTGYSYSVLRIKPDVASSLVSNGSLNTTWYEGEPNFQESPNSNRILGDSSASSSSSSSTTQTPGYDVDDDSEGYEIVKHGYGDSDKFYYNGMPVSGNYLGTDTSFWLIDALMDVVDWLVGIITIGYKIQIVGWSSLFQNLATGIVSAVVNEDANKSITVENILFNKIQILDVNFFNFNNAGGEKIENTDIAYILRQNVAGLYVSIRSIVIIVMLIILIYVGIRMAISTVSGDKAKYKKMFLGWIVGFIAIMFIHYFMVFIINANEQMINLMKPADNATVIYDEVRSYAYEIPASKGWTGAILYVFLVYYMIKLLLFYFKRLMVIYILSVIAPILGMTYAVEKVKGKSKSLTTWMKEFSFNVLIQSIHVIIYCIFMGIIYTFMKTTSIGKMLPFTILMILILNLMLKSEKIIKNIFGLKSNTLKDVTDTVLQTSSSLMTAYAISKPLINIGKNKITKVSNNVVKNNINRRYSHLENSLQDVQNSKLATDIQKEIDRLKQAEIDQRKEYNKNARDLSKNVFGGMRGMVTAIPMTFEGGPVAGTLSVVNAATRLNARMKPVQDLYINEDRIDALLKKYGMNPVNPEISQTGSASAGGTQARTLNTKKIKKNTGKAIGGFVAATATARATTKAKNMWQDAKAEKAKLSTPYQSARIELLYQLQNKVLEEEKKMDSSIETLKNNGFPPIYYTPSANESETTIMMNLQLQDKYSKELEINLRQAIEGNPTVTEDTVGRHIQEQIINNNKESLNLADLQKTLDEIAKENNYDVGTEFEENLRQEVARNAVNVVEGKDTQINKSAIRSEVLQKVERALRNNNWDETTAQSEIERAVTKDVSEEVIKHLSASELTSIITSAINSKGSLKKKPVDSSFEPLVNSVEKIADMNKDAAELEGQEYDADELINKILNKDIIN